MAYRIAGIDVHKKMLSERNKGALPECRQLRGLGYRIELPKPQQLTPEQAH